LVGENRDAPTESECSQRGAAGEGIGVIWEIDSLYGAGKGYTGNAAAVQKGVTGDNGYRFAIHFFGNNDRCIRTFADAVDKIGIAFLIISVRETLRAVGNV